MGDTDYDLVVGLTQDQYERLLFRVSFALGTTVKAAEGLHPDEYDALVLALQEAAMILRHAGSLTDPPPTDPPDPYAAVRARREPR